MNRAEALRREAEKLLQRADALESLSELYEMEDGDIISWTNKFDVYGRVYAYAAVKVPGDCWAVTGRDSNYHTTDQLIEKYLNAALEIKFH